MKIQLKKPAPLTFGDLPQGHGFFFPLSPFLFMKIEESVGGRNAVVVSDGDSVHVDEDREVIAAKVKVVPDE